MQKLLRRIAKHMQKKSQFNRTFRELSQLTDKELADIGINRTDITRVAKETTILN